MLIRTLNPARARIGFALCIALLALLVPACEKRTTRTIPEVLVPSIESEPRPAPEPQTTPAENTNPVPETTPSTPAPQTAEKPKPKPRKPVARKPVPTPAAPTAAEAAKPEAVKPEAAKPETPKPLTPDSSVQITADVPRAAVQTQTWKTEQLLRSSQIKLGGLNRSLSESEQAMVQQAHNYITQSNQAIQSGDIERAYNLAVKASLLANELTK
jgi:hypothetical protein